jgi:hypothetical protein
MKTAKTPYEIRLELLILAHNILRDKHAAEHTKAALTANSAADGIIGTATTYATTEEVISEAEKLNKFVSSS